MNTMIEAPMPNQEIEELLPWYSTGKLSPSQRARVEAALADDAHLRLSLALIEDDRAAAIAGNEDIGAPSTKAYDKLFAAIDAEGPRQAPLMARAKAGVVAMIADFLGSLSPRQLAYGAIAAAVVLMVQATALTGVLVGGGASSYSTASGPDEVGLPGNGTYLLVGFQPYITADAMTRFLETHSARIIDGPRAGGLFRIEIARNRMARSDADQIVASMRSKADVVRFVGVSP